MYQSNDIEKVTYMQYFTLIYLILNNVFLNGSRKSFHLEVGYGVQIKTTINQPPPSPTPVENSDLLNPHSKVTENRHRPSPFKLDYPSNTPRNISEIAHAVLSQKMITTHFNKIILSNWE